MPAYDAEPYIASALSSLARQTFGDFEVVVVDDCSNDDTAGVVERAARDDERIRLHRHAANGGPAASLRTGCAVASGALIARLDADDLAAPGRLDAQVSLLGRYPEVGLVGSWATVIDETDRAVGELREPRDSASIAAKIFLRNCVVSSSATVRRDVIAAIGGFRDVSPAEDWDAWNRLQRVSHIVNIPQPLASYRVHEHGISQNLESMSDAQARVLADGIGWLTGHAVDAALCREISDGRVGADHASVAIRLVAELFRGVVGRFPDLRGIRSAARRALAAELVRIGRSAGSLPPRSEIDAALSPSMYRYAASMVWTHQVRRR
jgi:hypothetical protein